MKSGLTFDQVSALHFNGDLLGAEKGYRSLIAEKVEDPNVYLNLGAICLDTNRIDEAIDLLHSSLRLNRDYADAHNNLGIALLALGRFDEAASAFRRAIRIRPDYA